MISSPFIADLEKTFAKKLKEIEKARLRELLKEIDEEDAAKVKKENEPEFKIDKRGFYETSGGSIVFIKRLYDDCCYGYHQTVTGYSSDGWAPSGKFNENMDGHPLDIVKRLEFKPHKEN